ncbi:MAG TPA: hypothetical protein VGN15_07135, partial [Ktedonobacteraceae bacterium]|nr:hypothetical protein [Ktedonobacteraceae bacterium]
EAGLEQLANHVEHRAGQVTQNAQATTRNQPGKVVAPTPKTTVPPPPATASLSTSQPTQRPTNLPSLPPAPIQLHEPAPTASTMPPTRETVQPPTSNDQELAVPPTRHYIGASMPSAPGTSGDVSGSMKLPQFIQYIKESMGLTPKQAMDLLNVKTLSGLNLRDALEQLQSLVVRETVASTPTVPTPIVREQKATKPDTKTPPANPAPVSPPPPTPIPISSVKTPGLKEITNAVVRDAPSSYPANFDEEIDLDNDEEEELDLGGDEGIEFLPELTDSEREIAGEVFDKLKETRGTSTASEQRLRAMHNVVNDQVSDEQLLQIIDGVWGVNAFKKLKSDQVEALISWAKEDEFITEAELVIMLIQEGQYARSDR